MSLLVEDGRITRIYAISNPVQTGAVTVLRWVFDLEYTARLRRRAGLCGSGHVMVTLPVTKNGAMLPKQKDGHVGPLREAAQFAEAGGHGVSVCGVRRAPRCRIVLFLSCRLFFGSRADFWSSICRISSCFAAPRA